MTVTTPGATVTGPATVTAASSTDLVGVTPVQTATAVTGSTTAVRDPTLTVHVPAGAQASDYTAATVQNLTPGGLVKASLLPSGIDLGIHRVGPDGSATTTFDLTGLSPGTHTVRGSPH